MADLTRAQSFALHSVVTLGPLEVVDETGNVRAVVSWMPERQMLGMHGLVLTIWAALVAVIVPTFLLGGAWIYFAIVKGNIDASDD